MKITKENALEEYPKVREGMPEAIEETFEKLPKLLKFYGRNDGITEVVDIWLEKVNAALAKREPKEAEPKEEKPKAEPKPKAEKLPKPKFKVGDKVHCAIYDNDEDNKTIVFEILHFNYENGEYVYYVTGDGQHYVKESKITKAKAEKPKKEPKAKAEKQPKEKKAKEKKEPEGEPVAKISPEVAIIKRFVNCCKGDKGRETARKILAALQKHIVNKEIRKTSQYAKEIMDIQKALIAIVYKKQKPSFDEAEFARFEKLSKSECQEPIAQLSRSFIRLIGQSGVKGKAKSLLEKLEAADSSDSLVAEMVQALHDYIDGSTDTIEPKQRSLQGIFGLAGI